MSWVSAVGNQRVDRFAGLAVTQLGERVDESESLQCRRMIEDDSARMRMAIVHGTGRCASVVFRQVRIVDSHEAGEKEPILSVAAEEFIGNTIVKDGIIRF